MTAPNVLAGHTAEILAAWQQLAHEPHWPMLPPHHRPDLLGEVLFYDLLAAACAREDGAGRAVVSAAAEAVVRSAVAHGRRRRELLHFDEVILVEFQLLREAVYRAARRARPRRWSSPCASSGGSRSPMYGHHRDRIEAQGEWAGAVERLLAEARRV